MFNLIRAILKVLWAPIFVLLVHILFSFLNFHVYYKWLDIPVHFAGGFSIALSSFVFFKVMQKKNFLGKMNLSMEFLFVISLVSLTAILWELMEFVADFFLLTGYQVSLKDTIGDLFFGLSGGIFCFLFRRIFDS